MVDGVKKYWIRNCINTFGYEKDCPVCKKNMEYWNSAFESDKKLASQRKRKLNFVSNILVIKNPANPDDEGKVFLYQYGQKIYDKMKQLMFPSDEDMLDPDFKSFIPFDLEEGADFLLKVKKQGDFPNYDDSKFSGQKPLGDEKKIDAEIKGLTKRFDRNVVLDNLNLSIQLLEWCTQHQVPFIYASSAATYGNGQHGFDVWIFHINIARKYPTAFDQLF